MGRISYDAETWMVAAACLGHTDLFFAPDAVESRGERAYRESLAKSVCHECVVRSHCLTEALKSDERFGIWGGLTERERRAARRSTSPEVAEGISHQDIASPGRLARLPAVVVRGRAMSRSSD